MSVMSVRALERSPKPTHHAPHAPTLRRREQNEEKGTNVRVADYKDLRVYNLAFESAMEIYELSKKFPSEEKFSLTDQIRRSSRSVCTNMAEAWRKRRYEAAFVSKLSDSDGEAAETEVHLAFALRCGYLPPDKHTALMDHYDTSAVKFAR